MKKKIIPILLNQYFLTFIISITIIFFIPEYFTKYKVTFISQHSALSSKVYFEDLNNDSKSELIMCRPNSSNQASFMLKNSNGLLIDQWNFSGKLLEGNQLLSFLDIDKNGFREVYLFTQKSDSIFLNIIEPFVEGGINKTIFLDTLTDYNEEYRLWGSKIIEDKNNLFFTLNAGFGGTIRNAYKVNLESNKILKSSHLTNRSIINRPFDINNDGLDEFTMLSYSSCNSIDSTFTKRSDCSSWLTVLNNDLKFEFEPIEFNNQYSSVYSIPLKTKSTFGILCLVVSRDSKNRASHLIFYSNNGKKLKEKVLPLGEYVFSQKPSLNTFLLFNINTGLVQEFNNNLNEINSFYIEANSNIIEKDIDHDEKKEWIATSRGQNNITIYNPNFGDAITFETVFKRTDNLEFSLKQVNKQRNELVFQKGDSYAIYSYFKNPYYNFKYLIYLGIYLLIYGISWLISLGQKIRMEKKIAIQSEIAEYQIKTIKNQVDPHFVFNAINTISGLMLADDKLKADEFICQFSNLMRTTLEKSDKITCTLQEEIEFVENYIKLQLTRFDNRFSYKIDIAKNVKLHQQVPKHILYTYVENAIKHGFSNSKKGELTIKITENEQLILLIENSDIDYYKINKTKMNSTGNGIKIMNEIYTLYKQLYKKKIKHELNPIFDKENKEIGFSIKVSIIN